MSDLSDSVPSCKKLNDSTFEMLIVCLNKCLPFWLLDFWNIQLFATDAHPQGSDLCYRLTFCKLKSKSKFRVINQYFLSPYNKRIVPGRTLINSIKAERKQTCLPNIARANTLDESAHFCEDKHFLFRFCLYNSTKKIGSLLKSL